jgi:hypothetical protein
MKKHRVFAEFADWPNFYIAHNFDSEYKTTT